MHRGYRCNVAAALLFSCSFHLIWEKWVLLVTGRMLACYLEIPLRKSRVANHCKIFARKILTETWAQALDEKIMKRTGEIMMAKAFQLACCNILPVFRLLTSRHVVKIATEMKFLSTKKRKKIRESRNEHFSASLCQAGFD